MGGEPNQSKQSNTCWLAQLLLGVGSLRRNQPVGISAGITRGIAGGITCRGIPALTPAVLRADRQPAGHPMKGTKMAIKQATNVLVEDTAYEYMAVQITPKVKNRDTGEVKLDRLTGLPVWSVDCLRMERAGTTVSTVAVSVPCKQEPKLSGQKVSFANLVAMQWATESGSGLAFRADSVEPVAARGAKAGV